MAKKSTIIKLNVRGIDLAIDERILSSYEYLRRIKANVEAVRELTLNENQTMQSRVMETSMDVIEYVLGDQLDDVLKGLGEYPSYDDVVTFYREVRDALQVKNL